MKVLFLAWFNEQAPSSRSRVFQYLPYLDQLCVSTKVLTYNSPLSIRFSRIVLPKAAGMKLLEKICLKSIQVINICWQRWSIFRLLSIAQHYDIVVIQKIILKRETRNHLLRLNPNLVFDMDDAIYADRAYDVDGLSEQLRFVKLSVVENSETEAFFRSQNVPTLRITGPMECNRYKPANRSLAVKRLTIGWIGSTSTSKNLKLVEKALKTVLDRFDFVQLLLVGSTIGIEHSKSICRPWSLKGELELLSSFDIGIMPLPDDEWSRGKGGYKLLQYMAMGIPSVISPVGVNNEIQIDGETGFFATTENEWVNTLSRLIENSRCREEMGKAARARVLKKYSYETYAPLLIEALNKIKDPPSIHLKD